MPSSYPCPYPEEIQKSLYILGYCDTTCAPSSLKDLNKRFHILALKHHPDKCVHLATAAASEADAPDVAATEKFKEINQAHKCLVDYFYSGADFDHDTSQQGYNSILQFFIQTMISKHNIRTADSIQSLIHHIITKGVRSAISLFRSMDKQTALMIYDILSNNQDLFGISIDTMDEITNIMEEKTSADIVIRLNPSLLDMLLDRVYILHEGGHTYYIPLWHSELHFKLGSMRADEANSETDAVPAVSGGELIVLCDPELPDNVSIDDYNNLYISLDISVNELFKTQVLPVVINEETKVNRLIYYLHAADVTLRTDITQRVLLHGCGGIASIQTTHTHTHANDMYKVDKRANVYANIRLVV